MAEWCGGQKPGGEVAYADRQTRLWSARARPVITVTREEA